MLCSEDDLVILGEISGTKASITALKTSKAFLERTRQVPMALLKQNHIPFYKQRNTCNKAM